jgi:hypothetical protein
MKFAPPVQGMSMEQITIDGINASLKLVYDKHLGATRTDQRHGNLSSRPGESGSITSDRESI